MLLAKQAEDKVQSWIKDQASPEELTIHDILLERKKRYGIFTEHANISQALENTMRATEGWHRLEESQREALAMIAHKIARILNGDPSYVDSWTDIAGYATLVEQELNGKLV